MTCNCLLTSTIIFHLGQDCSRVHFLPLRIEGRTTVHFVRFNSQPCNGNFDYMQSQPFCEISDWGDEEASVVCRSQLNRQYGIGGKPP